MITKERIEQYKRWFSNLSFFEKNSFVIDNIEDLWTFVKKMNDHFSKISRETLSKIELTKLDKKQIIDMSQSFLNNHKIKLNIQELIDNGVLVIEDEKKLKNGYDNTTTDGMIYYDEEEKKIKITIRLENSIFDCGVLIHELMHYLNQPNGKRNTVSDLLTEAVSFSIEMIFYKEIEESYPDDSSKMNYGFMRTLNAKIYYSYYIYKIIYLYKIKKDINEDLYSEVFNDKYYEETLDAFEKYVSNRKSIFKDTWNVISLPLVIYILDKYNNGEIEFDSIIEFSNNINSKSMEECMNILGITSKEDYYKKTLESLKKEIERINKIIEEMNKKSKKVF